MTEGKPRRVIHANADLDGLELSRWNMRAPFAMKPPSPTGIDDVVVRSRVANCYVLLPVIAGAPRSMHGEAMLYPVSGRIDMARPARCLVPLAPMRRNNS